MFTEDLSIFFNSAEHALAATYDGATAVSVIFDHEYIEALTGVAGTNPIAMGKATDFVDPVGKTLLISGVTYTIRNKRLVDDGAIVTLDLETP